MIQEFLTNNLIQITEDENVDKLLKASALLEKKLTKDKSKIPTFTLIALDPDISPSDPNVLEVQQLIIDNWKTFTTNCKDTPLTYIRAVILETLEKLTSNIDVTNIVWMSSRDIQKYLKLKGKEKELITDFLTKLGNAVETHATENWQHSSDSNMQKLGVEIKEITGVKLNNAKIDAHFKAAAIHSGWGEGGENPHTQAQNNKNWSIFFSERISRGLTSEINSVLGLQTKELNTNQTQIKETLNNVVSNLLIEFSKRNITLQMRTDLLWWKEACYSNTLKYSYRHMPKGLLEITLATDYASFVLPIYPQSVDYFLKETYKGIISEEDKKMKLLEILKLIDASKETLKQYIKEETFLEERISLLDFVRGFIFDKFSTKKCKDYIGITENTELTLSEFSLWLFHDLQVKKYFKK